jgi:hypothetical protein
MELFPEKFSCLGYELASLSCDIFSNSSEMDDEMLEMPIYPFHDMVGGGGGDRERGAGNII